MKILLKFKSNLLIIKNLFGVLAGLLSIGTGKPCLADLRLVERSYDPEIAARGFTGIAGCSNLSCLDFNPAFLYSENEDIKSFFSVSTRFNKELLHTVNNWKEVSDLADSVDHSLILNHSWNLLSRQTARIETDVGLRVQSFALSYSPFNSGLLFFGHDPVLPYGEFYSYQLSALRMGYAFRISPESGPFQSLSIGASLKYIRARTQEALLNQISDSAGQGIVDRSSDWITGRVGVTAVLDFSRYIALSAVVSGIPVYGETLSHLPTQTFLDFQPGLAAELLRFKWGGIQSFYSVSRLTQNESPLLKQNFGIQANIGQFNTSIGVSDAMLTYGLSLNLPIFKFTIASYGLEYSSLAHTTTDRVYWLKIQI